MGSQIYDLLTNGAYEEHYELGFVVCCFFFFLSFIP